MNIRIFAGVGYVWIWLSKHSMVLGSSGQTDISFIPSELLKQLKNLVFGETNATPQTTNGAKDGKGNADYEGNADYNENQILERKNTHVTLEQRTTYFFIDKLLSVSRKLHDNLGFGVKCVGWCRSLDLCDQKMSALAQKLHTQINNGPDWVYILNSESPFRTISRLVDGLMHLPEILIDINTYVNDLTESLFFINVMLEHPARKDPDYLESINRNYDPKLFPSFFTEPDLVAHLLNFKLYRDSCAREMNEIVASLNSIGKTMQLYKKLTDWIFEDLRKVKGLCSCSATASDSRAGGSDDNPVNGQNRCYVDHVNFLERQFRVFNTDYCNFIQSHIDFYLSCHAFIHDHDNIDPVMHSVKSWEKKHSFGSAFLKFDAITKEDFEEDFAKRLGLLGIWITVKAMPDDMPDPVVKNEPDSEITVENNEPYYTENIVRNNEPNRNFYM